MAAMNTDQELERLAKRVGAKLLREGQHVVTAESCTGGWLAKALTDIPGSSQWFDEGWVTYTNDAKRRRLGVPAGVLKRHGAVSEHTVRAMVNGALARTKADWAVAVSGIAGPGGAVPDKPVGTVWFAWGRRRPAPAARRPTASRRHEKSLLIEAQVKYFKGDRESVRRKAVEFALRGLLIQ